MSQSHDFPCFIDFEASGLADDSYPIEVAWNVADETIEGHLISPETVADWTHWDDSAQANAHGISRRELKRFGQPPQKVARRINERLHDMTVYSDAPLFDGFWLSRLFDAAQMQPSFILGDICDLFDPIIDQTFKQDGDTPHHKQARFERVLDTWGLQAWEKIALRPHRAAHDVRHLMETYRLLLENEGRIP